MSSFVRRIERQVMPSRVVHQRFDSDGKPDGKPYANDPRAAFYMGRGDKLGTNNPKDKALVARLAREAKRAKAREGVGG